MRRGVCPAAPLMGDVGPLRPAPEQNRLSPENGAKKESDPLPDREEQVRFFVPVR